MNDPAFNIRISAGARSIVSIDGFAIPRNQVTFLFGESGIGKSTLCKAVYGLLDPDELNITINNTPYTRYLRTPETLDIAVKSFFVFQEPSSHLNPLMKISTQMSEGSLADSSHDNEILGDLFNTGDTKSIRHITDIHPKPYRPSGGEKQRVLLAMAFKKIDLLLRSGDTTSPTLFVFDEPTGSLDDSYRNLFLKMLFERFEKRPFTACIITHDYSIISQVYKSHSRLVGDVRFKELSRVQDDCVTLRDFSPQDYLTWLNLAQQKPQSPPPQDETVLRFDADVTVFGRRLRIYGDPGRTQAQDLVIRKGEMVYLKAPSGVGKTTVAKIVMGLYGAQKFSMTLDGMRINEHTSRDLWRRRIWGRRAGMVFQHADESLNLQARVHETFMGLPVKTKISGELLKNRLAGLFADELTDAFLNKKVALLSGGQKQRMNLLRTLVLDTKLIVLDEPLNGLDFVSLTKVLGIIEEKRKQGAAILMISHNEEIFDAIIGREHTLYLGEVEG